ncbi:alpha/beta hydrolase [Colletotrichum graminicola]|uniref:Alpha/beta hydrolase n=1 Tax=Colletotrichum graminicola (strain M1.001 / M2 / FGSC 10212) TaxID=645133 RepID=E3QUN0_COLGM|nr:alpha/beta hydrolase [Colletotrichum graminicola M1.001]EFQ34568.1 alpha/beta hydrolase [Colletotrichum graminicola M1.001]WDK22649.1 alpha/beta hydrolase [Colletotrichum graminicola]
MDILPWEFFNFEFIRVLSMAPTHGADVGECLEAASKIKKNDPEIWYQAWAEAADLAEEAADTALKLGDREAARWAFLRACNYRRASEYMLHVNPYDTRLLGIMEKSVSNFRSACDLFDNTVETFEIPYENTKLPGYMYLPTPKSGGKPRGEKVPLLLAMNGFDSTQEELYFFIASGSASRGYAVMTFDGPGQGIVLRRPGQPPIRRDWEVVVSAVLDSLWKLVDEHPEWNIDLDRIGIMGMAMGAYFALRGATDPRIKACISCDGFYDFGPQVRLRSPFFLKYLTDGQADAILEWASGFNMQHKLEFGHLRMVFGTKSCIDALRKLGSISLEAPGEKPICAKVKCPVMVMGARDTIYTLETHLTYQKLAEYRGSEEGLTLWDPVGPGQGSLQAKVGAVSRLQMKVFSWLDEVFGIQRPPIAKQPI